MSERSPELECLTKMIAAAKLAGYDIEVIRAALFAGAGAMFANIKGSPEAIASAHYCGVISKSIMEKKASPPKTPEEKQKS